MSLREVHYKHRPTPVTSTEVANLAFRDCFRLQAGEQTLNFIPVHCSLHVN